MQAFKNLLEQEKQALQNALLEMERKFRKLEQGELVDKEEKSRIEQGENTVEQLMSTNEEQLTVETSETEPEQQEEKGGFWYFLFGWI